MRRFESEFSKSISEFIVLPLFVKIVCTLEICCLYDLSRRVVSNALTIVVEILFFIIILLCITVLYKYRVY